MIIKVIRTNNLLPNLIFNLRMITYYTKMSTLNLTIYRKPKMLFWN